jgi:hypothetical protein
MDLSWRLPHGTGEAEAETARALREPLQIDILPREVGFMTNPLKGCRFAKTHDLPGD